MKQFFSAKEIEERLGVNKCKLHHYRVNGVVRVKNTYLGGTGNSYPYSREDFIRIAFVSQLEGLGIKLVYAKIYMENLILNRTSLLIGGEEDRLKIEIQIQSNSFEIEPKEEAK